MNLTTKWILDHYSTTEKAVAFLKKVPHVAAFNFLIADSENNIARVEASPKKVHAIYYDDGFAVSTNHYLSEEMKEVEMSRTENPNGSSDTRYDNAMNWFEKKKGIVTEDHARELTSVHEGGLCDHYEYENKKGGTIWSWIHTIGEPDILVASGSPCKNEYVRSKISLE